MLKLMLIQRGGATTHQIMNNDVDFDDFHNMVTYQNFGHKNKANETKRTVYFPHSDTTYTMLVIKDAAEL